MSRKKSVITQMFGGYVNTAISIIQSLLLLPLYLKYIDIDTYGYWITIGSIIALISMVNFGLGNMAIQRISSSYAEKNFKKVSDYFINSLVLYIVISIVFVIIGSIVVVWLENFLSVSDNKYDSSLTLAYTIAMITMIFTFFNNSLKGFSQALLKPLFGVNSTIIARLIGLVLVVYLLMNNIGLTSIPISLLAVELMIFFSNGIYVSTQYRKLGVKPDINKNIINEYLHMSPHLFKQILGNTLSNTSYPIIITAFIGAEMTTAYTVTRKAVDVILQMLNVVNASLLAPFSHLIGEGDKIKAKEIVQKITFVSLMASLIMCGVYIVSNDMFVNLWVGENLALGDNIVFLIGTGALTYSLTRLFRSYLYGLNLIEFTSGMVLLEGTIFVVMSILLIKYIGVISVPLSLFIASSVVAVLMFKKVLEQLKFEMIYKIRITSLIVLVGLYIFYIQNLSYGTTTWGTFFLQVVIGMSGIATIELFLMYKIFKIDLKGKK